MSTVLENVAAVQNEKQQNIIGYLTWYSIGEHLITRDELKQKLTNAGLDEGWMPNDIRSSDAFRRATQEVKARKATAKSGVFENYIVREVYADKKMVQRNIVCEVVDQNGKRLNYDPSAAVMTLNKDNDTMTVMANSTVAKELAEDAEKLFKVYKDHYSAQALRVMAMNIMKSMSPTPVRPNGGVYFIPSAHTETLMKLERFLNSLDKGEGFKVPLINTTDNREMISKKLTEHLEATLNECKVGLKRELKKGQVKMIIDDAKRVIKDYSQYQNLVMGDISKMDAYVELIRRHVEKIIEKM